MTTRCFRTSRPDLWTLPKPYSDPSLRALKYGPIQPMDDERGGFWRRLFCGI
jgi:hypothetical protein